MLYINPALSKPVRIQGIYISSKEIEKVTNHIKLNKEPEYDDNTDLKVEDKNEHEWI